MIVITTKEVQKALSTDQRLKTEVKMKLDVVCIQEEGDMGTADALRHIQQKIKVCNVTITDCCFDLKGRVSALREASNMASIKLALSIRSHLHFDRHGDARLVCKAREHSGIQSGTSHN